MKTLQRLSRTELVEVATAVDAKEIAACKDNEALLLAIADSVLAISDAQVLEEKMRRVGLPGALKSCWEIKYGTMNLFELKMEDLYELLEANEVFYEGLMLDSEWTDWIDHEPKADSFLDLANKMDLDPDPSFLLETRAKIALYWYDAESISLDIPTVMTDYTVHRARFWATECKDECIEGYTYAGRYESIEDYCRSMAIVKHDIPRTLYPFIDWKRYSETFSVDLKAIDFNGYDDQVDIWRV